MGNQQGFQSFIQGLFSLYPNNPYFQEHVLHLLALQYARDGNVIGAIDMVRE